MWNILYYVLVIIGIWFIVNIVYRLKEEYFTKRGFKLYYGLILLYRKGRTVKPFPMYKKISYIHVIIFVLALISFYSAMIPNILVKRGFIKGEATVQLLIPGINVTGVQLIYFIIAVVIAAYIHEYLHAYTAASHGLKVKSMGFAIIFLIPIAFTEIDEDDLRNASRRAKIAVLSAGPSANYLLALLFLGLMFLSISPYGIVVLDVTPNSLAEKYGIKPHDILIRVNGEPVTRYSLAKYLRNKSAVNFTLEIISHGVLKKINIYKPENITRLGITFSNKPNDILINTLGLEYALAINYIILWLYIVNFGLALINAAPIFISDGGRIFYEITSKKYIGHIINTISLAILILAVTP